MCSVLASGGLKKGVEAGLVTTGSTEEVGPGRKVGFEQTCRGKKRASPERG